MSIKPAVTVLTATRNRATFLERFLLALSRNDFVSANAELLIVDNGSTDHTPDVLASFATRTPWPVRVLHQPQRGKSRALNLGLQHTEAPLVVLTDDDCYLEPGYLLQALRVFQDADIDFCGGRILLHDPTDARYTVDYRDAFRRYPAGTLFAPGTFQGANMVVRRAVVDAIGGFDPELGAGVRFRGEDLDFCYRASLAGFTGAYVPQLVVYHHHQRKPGPQLERLRALDRESNGAIYAKLMRLHFSAFAGRWLADTRRLLRRGQVGAIFDMVRGGMMYRAKHHRAPSLIIPLASTKPKHQRVNPGERSP
ncbi:MAG: glycosyltransferase [Phycisphaerae bacterium]|nr:glycosyltransferase [Phycisphaerae bacterium]